MNKSSRKRVGITEFFVTVNERLFGPEVKAKEGIDSDVI